MALVTLLTAGLFAVPASAASSATYLQAPASRTIQPGTTTEFTTRLTSGGMSVTGRPVRLYVYYNGAWRWLRTAWTDSQGAATFAYAPRASRYFKIRFAGDSRYLATTTPNFRVTVATSSLGDAAMREALRHMGKDYQWAAAGPYRFDCSGFTLYVFGRLGRRLPHNSAQQYSVVRQITKTNKRPGDLIFFRNSSGSIDHVGIYAGGNYVYAASRSADQVKKQYIYTSRYSVGRVG